MDHLYRDLAPISEAGWEQIESEAKGRLVTHLAARKLVDLVGPHGWSHSSTTSGGSTRWPARLRASPHCVAASCRWWSCRPTSPWRARSRRRRPRLGRHRSARARRGGAPDRAGRELDRFHGYAAAGMLGITECSSHEPLSFVEDMEQYPNVVAQAVNVLRGVGIGGPYGLAIDPKIYTGIVETAEHGGLLLFDHLRQILDGPLVWSPGVQGGVVLSLRGGDFVLESGQDLSIGYSSHDADVVRLYIEESFSFRVLEPDAAVALRRS